jgi:NADH dehydrogenase
MKQLSEPKDPNLHHIVIVGGGAGGLELATRLGNALGRKKKAAITLIDQARTHLWKPLLHEVAAGSLNSHDDELEYLAQAKWHHFRFRLGRMEGIDREQREVYVAPTFDQEGREIVPRRVFKYDTLVIAVGSLTNTFGTPGAKEHCMMLDTTDQATKFHQHLINACLRAHTQAAPIEPGQLTVAIIGAGATGVELAAELHETTRQLYAYGLERIEPEKNVRLVIIEAAHRVLPGLPERLSEAADKQLRELKVNIFTGERVVEVLPNGVRTKSGLFIPACTVVWAAGIKAPDFLATLDDLEVNHLNQLMVKPTLETTRDPNIFALGDCAHCPQPNTSTPVPPRAQAANQQATLLAKSLARRLAGRELPRYVYRDYGSLVALGRYTTVGNLMGGLAKGSLMIEGQVARFVYWSLYKKHQIALHGLFRVVLSTLATFINSPNKPRVKLH